MLTFLSFDFLFYLALDLVEECVKMVFVVDSSRRAGVLMQLSTYTRYPSWE